MNEEFELRLSKLPQWAQRYISKLRRDITALLAERGKIICGDAKITFWVNFGENHGIPDRATVQFHLENDIIDFSLRNNVIRVHSSQHHLTIEPAASNAVNISAWRWHKDGARIL